jgi:DNA-binding XRE family transcriptional regulator
MNKVSEFAHKVFSYRAAHGYSQQDLADIVGCSKVVITKIENDAYAAEKSIAVTRLEILLKGGILNEQDNG